MVGMEGWLWHSVPLTLYSLSAVMQILPLLILSWADLLSYDFLALMDWNFWNNNTKGKNNNDDKKGTSLDLSQVFYRKNVKVTNLEKRC